MPASTLEPVSAALRIALAQNSSENVLNSQLSGSARRILNTNIELESSKNYQNTVLNNLKSKYIVLHSSNTTPQKNKKSEMGADETLSVPQIVLYPLESVQLGWHNTSDWNVGAGLINMGNTCYLNSTLQALFHVPALANWLLSDKSHMLKCDDAGGGCIICAMSKTLQASQQRNGNAIRPWMIYSKLRIVCRHLVPGRQEDAHEFLRYLVEAMERAYIQRFQNIPPLDIRSKETTPLNQILGGYLRSAVRCLECGHVSTTFQHFQDLLLDIKRVSTLDEALELFFSREKLDDMAYHCENCQKKVLATKQFSLERAPMVLCIQLKRFSVSNIKITKHIAFRQRLELTRFARRKPSVPLVYRLVSIVTHVGQTVGCGHYTAIAQAPSGNFYQFDDSMVRPISQQSVFNTNAYIMLYELENSSTSSQPSPKSSPVPSSNSNNNNNNNNSNSTISNSNKTFLTSDDNNKLKESQSSSSLLIKDSSSSIPLNTSNGNNSNSKNSSSSNNNNTSNNSLTTSSSSSSSASHLNGTLSKSSNNNSVVLSSSGQSQTNQNGNNNNGRFTNGGGNRRSRNNSSSSSNSSSGASVDGDGSSDSGDDDNDNSAKKSASRISQKKNSSTTAISSSGGSSSNNNNNNNKNNDNASSKVLNASISSMSSSSSSPSSSLSPPYCSPKSTYKEDVSQPQQLHSILKRPASAAADAPPEKKQATVTTVGKYNSSHQENSVASVTKLVPYEVDDSSSSAEDNQETSTTLVTTSTTAAAAAATAAVVTTSSATMQMTQQKQHQQITTKAGSGTWQVSTVSNTFVGPSSQGQTGWSRRQREAITELVHMSHEGYSMPVSTWNGTRAALDREVNNERREDRKRTLHDNNPDRNKVKQPKHNNNGNGSGNNSYKSNPGYNPFQEYNNNNNRKWQNDSHYYKKSHYNHSNHRFQRRGGNYHNNNSNSNSNNSRHRDKFRH